MEKCLGFHGDYLTCKVNPREETRNGNFNSPVEVYQAPGVLTDHVSQLLGFQLCDAWIT